MTQYQFDNAWHDARRRLALLEARADPGTIRHLEALGVGAGWHCLEVGAGGGSIARWLCRRVGPSGRVLATDLDTRFIEALDEANLEIRRHNILTDDLPEGPFDLVHARALLMHLAEPQRALRRMVAVLKPGGWLVAEEGDYVSWVPDPTTDPTDAERFMRWWNVGLERLAAGGMDPCYGRRLYGELCAQGLLDVAAEGRVPMVRGGSEIAQFWRISAQQALDAWQASGSLSEQDAAEMRRVLALLDSPSFVWMAGITMAAWGRRPA